MESDLEYRFERRLQARLDELVDSVSRGSVEDWAAYKYLCGEIYGIRFAMQELADEQNKVISEENFG